MRPSRAVVAHLQGLSPTAPFQGRQPGEGGIPFRLGKYRLKEAVGEGGMSVVYLARDEVLERDVAIKVLHPHLARDPEARSRFAREARAVAQLRHPNIPEIYETGAGGADDMRAFIVNEFVDGAPLSRLLREGKVTLPETGIMLAVGVARALAKAHEHKVIHRDVKPENVLVGKDGVVKLTDFGIAQVLGLESMTMTGTLIGSPAHMAPEQIDGTRDLDHRVDVWGLGTVLYMCVTGGKLPFEADNPHRLLRKIADGELLDPRRLSAHVESSIAQIVMRCLQRDRAHRYQETAEVVRELEGWLATRGLTKIEAELREFMADPAGYEQLLAKRLEVTLMQLGDAALETRERHRALELFARVLAIDPDHAEASRSLRRLERRMRTRRGVWWALLGGLGVVVVVLIASAVFDATGANVTTRLDHARGAVLGGVLPVPVPPELIVTPPPIVEPPAGARFGDALSFELARIDGLLSQDKLHGPAGVDPHGAEVTRPDGTAGGHIKPAPTPIALQLTAEPPAIRVTLDGHTVSCPAEMRLVPGTYVAVLRHPKCPECKDEMQQVVVPKAAPGPIPVHFVFHQKAGAGPEAGTYGQLILRECPVGAYAEGDGKRYPCPGTYRLPIASNAPGMIRLGLYAADGSPLRAPQLFSVRMKEPIILTP